MMWREAREIGGIADEDAVLSRQVFLQLGSRGLADGTQEEIGLSFHRFDTLQLVKGLTQALSLSQIGVQVGDGLQFVVNEPLARLKRQGVDGPGAVLLAQSADNRRRSGKMCSPSKTT